MSQMEGNSEEICRALFILPYPLIFISVITEIISNEENIIDLPQNAQISC